MGAKNAKRERKLAKLPAEALAEKLPLPLLKKEYVGLYKDYVALVSASDRLYGASLRMRKVFWSVLIPMGILCIVGWAICIYQWTR